MNTKFIVVAAAILLVAATGILLTRSERSYGTALLTVHKLVDLGLVVWLGITAWRAHQAAPLGTGTWALLAGTVAVVVATFATGGVTSAMAEAPRLAVQAHRWGSWLAAGLTAASGWLLLRG